MYPAAYHPYHTNPIMHYSPQSDDDHDPRSKQIPSPHHHMKMDPLNSPTYQHPCPYPNYYGANSYCYPVPPQEYHGCCNNNSYFGDPYGFRPPYPPPPTPFHSHGFYTPFPGAYPAYSVPPLHYSVEQPRYDYYDKNNQASHHCWGCNHREDEKKPRIKPEEPEVEKKTSESLVPFLLKDSPYPIMWVPPPHPGYMNTESKAEEKDKYSVNDPLSLKNLEPSNRGGNSEIAPDQHDRDGNRFPLPIFWLPTKNNEVGKDTKENNLIDLVAHKGLPDETKKHEGSGSEAESETSNKHVVKKVIPVKQLGTDEEKKTLKVKSDSGKEGKAASSKLPPVCLRIDPPPRKKCSLRSPSPPSDKEKSKGSPVDNPKSSQQQIQMSECLKKGKEEQSKSSVKTVDVTNHDANKVEKDSRADPCENVKGQSIKGEPCEVEEKKKNLSEHEAALIIQSAYRGFQVRKSQPLTKLRQISEVRKQVFELRNRFQDLESTSSSTIYVVEKQKLIIGEIIMSLLLKLDTIQGLHPIVRDIRKSVAKELVGFQEKLDSITSVKPEAPGEEITSIKQVMHPEDDDDAIQEKSDQGQSQPDSNIKLVDSGLGLCENHEVEATESQDDDGGAEACNTNTEPQMELQNEQSTRELNNDQIQVLMDTTEQPVDDDAIQEKFDQALTQSDCVDTVICENNEVEDTYCVDNGGVEAHDMKPEQLAEQNAEELKNNQLQMSVETELPVESATQDKSDQVESDTDIYEVETADSYKDGGPEACDIYLVESESQQSIIEPCTNNQLEMPDTMQPDLTKAPQFESDAENVELFEEHPEVKAQESGDDGNVQTWLDKVPARASRREEYEVNGVQEEEFVVSTEEAPKADDVESSLGGTKPLMEENEKLRVAVEELMKAGNEQMGVIRELTGRLKDLEKRLRKKKIKKGNKCRPRACAALQERLRDFA